MARNKDHNKDSDYYGKNRFLLIRDSSMPEESEGKCKKCKKIRLLGDGYCTSCWDRKAAAARSYIELD